MATLEFYEKSLNSLINDIVDNRNATLLHAESLFTVSIPPLIEDEHLVTGISKELIQIRIEVYDCMREMELMQFDHLGSSASSMKGIEVDYINGRRDMLINVCQKLRMEVSSTIMLLDYLIKRSNELSASTSMLTCPLEYVCPDWSGMFTTITITINHYHCSSSTLTPIIITIHLNPNRLIRYTIST